MNIAAEIIRKYLKESGIKQAQLAKMMKVHPRNLSQMLRQSNDIKFQKFVDMLNHIGYEVQILKKGDQHVRL